MNNKNVSLSIRNEIHRFESVHPSIYSIYELLDGIQANDKIVNCIRQHVVNIEDSFVNSQEWTLSRSVKEIRIGILGSVSSGKSSLVHRYLTNTFLEDDSPEGGRFKKEVIINQKPYMLLLRDEGNAPELQFTNWVDGVLLISNSANTTNTCFSYVTKMASYRPLQSIPISVVSIGQPDELWISELIKIPHQLYFNCDPVSGLNVDDCFHNFSKFVLQFHQQQQQPSILRSNSTLSDSRSTPSSTPVSVRKEKLSRRKSNLFNNKQEKVGSGRIIPLKQGYLLKKSNHSVVTNVKGHYYGKKKWKKKYVTLSDSAIFYHQSIHEYMDDELKGKPIDLHKISVKATTKGETNNFGDSTTYGFQLVSFENKTWEFEASSKEERDEWTSAIEHQIFICLQGNVSNKNTEVVDPTLVKALRLLPGNDVCADCGSPNPDWASLNLCVLICISCSGIHRNLGSHISKVRSLDLDEWSHVHYYTLKYFNGNSFLKEIYESKKPPGGVCGIKDKYEQLQWIPEVELETLKETLVAAIEAQDKKLFLICLLNSSKFKVDVGHLLLDNSPMAQMLLWYECGVERNKEIV